MFALVMRFTDQTDRKEVHAEGHKRWIDTGFEEGVFFLVGSLHDRSGGTLLARGVTRDALEARAQNDPFVAHGVTTYEIIEFMPYKAAAGLEDLIEWDPYATA